MYVLTRLETWTLAVAVRVAELTRNSNIWWTIEPNVSNEDAEVVVTLGFTLKVPNTGCLPIFLRSDLAKHA